MSIAAVPKYLGSNFQDASPGMRFGLLLPIWTTRQDQEAEVKKRAQAKSNEGRDIANMLQRQGMDAAIELLSQRERNRLPGLWDKNDFAARNAWNNITVLTDSDRARMDALVKRQSTLSQTTPADNILRLDVLAVAPFTTGLGNAHPLENGFSFLNPYGLPYLPGSGVKGALRQAARELARGDWGDAHGWNEDRIYSMRIGEETLYYSMLDALFGLESRDGQTDHIRGALSFWDVIPQIKGNSLMVEIMTPHQGHYYQQRAHAGSVTPHESGKPNPISYLTVPPGSRFTFYITCNLPHLHRLASDLAKDGLWRALLDGAFRHAFDWLGFGAKTSVGYGAMTIDQDAEARRQQERDAQVAAQREKEEKQRREAEERERRRAEEERRAQLSPLDRDMEEVIEQDKDQSKKPWMKLLKALNDKKWSGDDARRVAERVRDDMKREGAWIDNPDPKKANKDKSVKRTLQVLEYLRG